MTSSPVAHSRSQGKRGTMKHRRLPLRWRVAVSFSLASLLTTGLLALATWKSASTYMLGQRQQSASRQAVTNAQLVGAFLRRRPEPDSESALDELEKSEDATVALRLRGRWTMHGRVTDPATLPSSILEHVPTPAPLHRTMVDGSSVLAVALPVPAQDAIFVELFPLAELDEALQFLKTVLLVGSVASAAFGLGLGRWAGREALRPLAELTRTAERVARGDWGARVPEQGDADLAPLAALFNRTTAALEQRVARDTRFAGDVSHELRSPLTTMINAVAVLNKRKDDLSETGVHALRLLTADLDRFHRMVIDLLEISRDHAAEDGRELEPCDFVDLVRHALEARHETTITEFHEPPPIVLADRRRLDRAVANLLDNAERHAGGAIRVAVAQQGDCARLEVDDAGPGIPPELRGQVFERFTRGTKSGDRRHTMGSGLGLALVSEHVRRNNGTVWIEDRPGGGSRFVVELPLIRDR